MNQKQHVLEAVNVSKRFMQGANSIHVLANVSYAFEQGNAYAIRGISGSGKSTLLHMLGGFDEPTSGDVLFDGQSIASLAKKTAFLQHKVGFVFQFHYLIKELSIRENIMLPGLVAGVAYEECVVRAQELLHLVGMTHRADMLPIKLSGGELQRAAIARALFNKPAFLIADEPTASLDRHNADAVCNLFLQMQQEWNMGLIICTHDQQVYSLLPNVLHLQEGRLLIENT